MNIIRFCCILPSFVYKYLSLKGNFVDHIVISDEVEFKISKLNNEFYLNSIKTPYGYVSKVYILGTYSGLFKLLEQSKNYFISTMLTNSNRNKNLRRLHIDKEKIDDI